MRPSYQAVDPRETILWLMTSEDEAPCVGLAFVVEQFAADTLAQRMPEFRKLAEVMPAVTPELTMLSVKALCFESGEVRTRRSVVLERSVFMSVPAALVWGEQRRSSYRMFGWRDVEDESD